MTESEIATEFDDLFPPLPNRIADLERQLAAMAEQRDHLERENADIRAEATYANLRAEVAVATSHAWIDAEVRRRIAEATDHASRAFPASALRQQRQAIGLLSTADAGRVRLGGYAPSLPSPTPRRCQK